MHRLLLLLLLVAPVAAQGPVEGPDVVMLVHHPYPDDADILGVPFLDDCERACDAFAVRHGGHPQFSDGVDFPGFIADGQIALEALVGGFPETLQAYEDAFDERHAVDTPLRITVGTRVVEQEVRTSIWVASGQELGAGLVLWVALVEDPVHYEPPPGLSNGVVEHPFTVRSVERIGAIVPSDGEGTRQDLVLRLDEEWDADAVRLAVWVEQDRGALGTFEPGEVVQAVSHPITSSSFTQRTERAVLIEAYSASWCDPCLIGDAALEALAEAHGLPTGRGAVESTSYTQPPPIHPFLLVLVAVAAGLAVALPRMGAR